MQGVSKDVADVKLQTEAVKSTLPAIQASISSVEERAEHAVSLAEAATAVGEGQVSAAETVSTVEEVRSKLEALEGVCKGQLSELEEATKGQVEIVKALSLKIVDNKSGLGVLSTQIEATTAQQNDLRKEVEGICEGSAMEIKKLHVSLDETNAKLAGWIQEGAGSKRAQHNTDPYKNSYTDRIPDSSFLWKAPAPRVAMP